MKNILPVLKFGSCISDNMFRCDLCLLSAYYPRCIYLSFLPYEACCSKD